MEKSLRNDLMVDCITVAIISIFNNNNNNSNDNEKDELKLNLLNVLFSSGIFNKEDIVILGQLWLENVILFGSKDKKNVSLCFTYLVNGAHGNAIDKQTGKSLIVPTKRTIQLLHKYNHTGPGSCLQWFLDQRVP